MGTGTAHAPVHPSTGPGPTSELPSPIRTCSSLGTRLGLGSLCPVPQMVAAVNLCQTSASSQTPPVNAAVCLGGVLALRFNGTPRAPNRPLKCPCATCWRPHLSHCRLLVCSPLHLIRGCVLSVAPSQCFPEATASPGLRGQPPPSSRVCSHPARGLPACVTNTSSTSSLCHDPLWLPPPSHLLTLSLSLWPHLLLPRPLLRAWHRCSLYLE